MSLKNRMTEIGTEMPKKNPYTGCTCGSASGYDNNCIVHGGDEPAKSKKPKKPVKRPDLRAKVLAWIKKEFQVADDVETAQQIASDSSKRKTSEVVLVMVATKVFTKRDMLNRLQKLVEGK